MTVQAHKVSSLTRLRCKIMADKAKSHDRDSCSECDSSEDSRNNDQKQARKKTKKYKTRYSKELELEDVSISQGLSYVCFRKGVQVPLQLLQFKSLV